MPYTPKIDTHSIVLFKLKPIKFFLNPSYLFCILNFLFNLYRNKVNNLIK